jgi:hypothetical protein
MTSIKEDRWRLVSSAQRPENEEGNVHSSFLKCLGGTLHDAILLDIEGVTYTIILSILHLDQNACHALALTQKHWNNNIEEMWIWLCN